MNVQSKAVKNGDVRLDKRSAGAQDHVKAEVIDPVKDAELASADAAAAAAEDGGADKPAPDAPTLGDFIKA